MLFAAPDLIPQKYELSSGFRDYRFRIARASDHFWLRDMDPYPFAVLRDSGWQMRAAPVLSFSRQVEAMAILSQLDGETERRVRYIDVHSAYEAVVHIDGLPSAQ